MILREISITGLYGYFDKHIEFKPDINLLVGINGSGKTSVLNLISWMLNPAYLPQLCITQFTEISLKLTFKTIHYTLVCRQKGREMNYNVIREGSKTRNFNPLEVLLLPFTEDIATKSETRAAYLEHFSGMKPNKKELKTWTFLQQLPKPVILGLDRTVARIAPDPRQTIPVTALGQIQAIANTNFSKYQSRLNNENNVLRNGFMLSAFNLSYLTKPVKRPGVKLDQIEKWRERFTKYMRQGPKSNTGLSPDLRTAAKHYFDKLETLLRSDSKEIDLSILSTESQKLERLFNHLEQFEHASEQAYEPIKSYLQILNAFFKDSSKELLFKADTNQICFQVLNKAGKVVATPRSVELLSSGEKQLFTLFTFIKFNTGGIYIIDEPELSLHPKWQDGFLEAIKTLMPIDTQLILATHSPAIVGRNRNYCTTLLPYN